MFVVSYFKVEKNNVTRCGMLVFSELEGGSPSALGGFDPSELGHIHVPEKQKITVVSCDNGERELAGWIHPDQLKELRGQDAPEVLDVH